MLFLERGENGVEGGFGRGLGLTRLPRLPPVVMRVDELRERRRMALISPGLRLYLPHG